MLGTRENWEWGEGRGYRQYERVGFSPAVRAAMEENGEVLQGVRSEISMGGDGWIAGSIASALPRFASVEAVVFRPENLD